MFKKKDLFLKSRPQIGAFGEERVARHIKTQLKMRIVCRNWRGKKGEIDIIAWDGPVMVFIEVRTRHKRALVPGYQSVRRKKKRALHTVCKEYLESLRTPPKVFRFDIGEVRFCHSEDFTINYYSNIPLFSRHYRAGFKN